MNSNEELYVAEGERSGFGRAGSVFARTEKKKESKADHIGNGAVGDRSSGKGDLHDAKEDLNRDGFYAIGRWVLLLVVTNLAGNSEIHDLSLIHI